MNNPRILVLGASGFIGGWVTKALLQQGHTNVRVGVRTPNYLTCLEHLSTEVACCDIMDRDSLESALNDVQVVVNCTRDSSDNGVTVEGTKRLLDASTRSGVKRLVYLSSIAVYGDASGHVTEETPAVGQLNKYGMEKRVAEELCRSASNTSLERVIVRPSLVYGPSGEEWTERFVRGIRSGRLKQTRSANGVANLIYAGDLGDFVAHLSTTSLPSFSVFNANGADRPTFNEYFQMLSSAMGLGELPHATRIDLAKRELRRRLRQGGRLSLRATRPTLSRLKDSNILLQRTVASVEQALKFDIGDEPCSSYSRVVHYSNHQAASIGFIPRTSLIEGVQASMASILAEPTPHLG